MEEKRDYKQIITTKSLNTAYYREGRAYLVKFHGDPKGNDIDNGGGAIGICTESAGGGVTFVFVKGTHIHENYNTNCVSLSCKYIDNSNIEIIPCFNDMEVLEIVEGLKRRTKCLKEDTSKTFPGLIVETDKTGTELKKVTEVEFISEGNTNDDKNEDDRPSIADFFINDRNNLLKNKVSHYYPLFIRRECDGRLVINLDIMEKFLNRKDITILVEIGTGNHTASFAEVDPDDIYIHNSSTTLTASKKKTTNAFKLPVKYLQIEIKSEEWRLLRFAHVHIKSKAKYMA